MFSPLSPSGLKTILSSLPSLPKRTSGLRGRIQVCPSGEQLPQSGHKHPDHAAHSHVKRRVSSIGALFLSHTVEHSGSSSGSLFSEESFTDRETDFLSPQQPCDNFPPSFAVIPAPSRSLCCDSQPAGPSGRAGEHWPPNAHFLGECLSFARNESTVLETKTFLTLNSKFK